MTSPYILLLSSFGVTIIYLMIGTFYLAYMEQSYISRGETRAECIRVHGPLPLVFWPLYLVFNILYYPFTLAWKFGTWCASEKSVPTVEEIIQKEGGKV